MGSNGGDEVIISGSETTVEIKIKTLDSQTYTLRVDKCVSVPALKEQIATVTGVLSEQQRLICRGKVLKDDQLLSAYHVEDGHTLHMVVRQPGQPSMDGSVDRSASNSGDHVHPSGPSVVVRTFDLSEPNDGIPPDISRIVSAVLGSFGVTNIGSGSEGADLSEAASEGIFRTIRVVSRNPGGAQTDQTTASSPSNLGTGVGSFSASAPLDPLQLPVIPDSLTTLTQYLTRMRNEFADGSSPQPGDNVTNDRQDSGGFPTPASLAEVIMSTRELLMNQSSNSLSQLAGQLEIQANVTDPLARMSIQSNALRTGLLLQHLGALLLELGRTTMTLRMGQRPAESVVNAGPAVFISTSGPNPIMVQPNHFQPGASVGTIPGIGQHDGLMGSGFHPRNIDIRIRAGPSMPSSPPTTSQGEATGAQQPQGQNGEATVPSSTRESEIRVMPIRTVVAALPASGTSRLPLGSFIPVVARVQRVSNANSGSQRGSQSSSSNQTVPQEGSGILGENGNRAQNSQDFSTGILSSFDQLLRSIYPSENIHISDMNIQGMGTGSPTSETGTSHGATAVNTASTQGSSPAGGDGVFLSNLLRQIMPIISENTAGDSVVGADDTRNNDAQTSPPQGQEDTHRETRSGRRGNPPSSPSSKRQRR